MRISVSGSNVLYGQIALTEISHSRYSPKLENGIDINLLVCLADFNRPHLSWWLFLSDYNQLKYFNYKKCLNNILI